MDIVPSLTKLDLDPRMTPLVLGHDTRSVYLYTVCISVCHHQNACSVRTAAKKGEEGSEHDQLYYPWGWGITLCVCVCMCAHPSQQMFIVQHRASPMITGIHSTQKQ